MNQLELSNLESPWLDQAEREFSEKIRGSFTTDDLHERLTKPNHHNLWGVLMARLKGSRRILKAGYQPSKRKEANGRVVAVWETISIL